MTKFLPEPCFAGRVAEVQSLLELLEAPFAGAVNALCRRRSLSGDFAGLVQALIAAGAGAGITNLEQADLRGLRLTEGAALARDLVFMDWAALEAAGLQPEVNLIDGYPHEAMADDGFPTHVQSFHVDRATGPADTWLCTYHGRSSWGLVNEDARWRVNDVKLRAELLRSFGEVEGPAFEAWLVEHFHDLHYLPRPGARVYEFGVGTMWKVACDHPGAVVLPCIHRAPDTPVVGGWRLLMIA